MAVTSIKFQEKFHQEPVFVGGFPGSGTRVISRILSACDIFMGNHLNESNGSEYFNDFLNRWVPEFITTDYSRNDELCKEMEDEFLSCLCKHLEGITPDTRWGLKLSVNILILPLLHILFPAMKFIHILRDGRDLAASKKKRTSVRKYSLDLIGREIVSTADMVELWRTITLRGFEYGNEHLSENYLLIRFEDLCRMPDEVIRRISEFANSPLEDTRIAAREVRPPSDAIGRWKHYHADFGNIPDRARTTLRRFGYE